MANKEIKKFTSGIHNLVQDDLIPDDAASDSLGWLTKDGRATLMHGRTTVGGDGGAGKSYAEHTAYRADGVAVRFRKVGAIIQALVGTTWTNVVTGLTEEADYVASNYQSLAGAFVYFFGVDGIYKVCVSNPTDYASMYVEAKNFKGYGFIDKARTILWGREKDPTGLYGSYIDGQDGDVYTTITDEALASVATGTLAFKAAGALRSCFGLKLTVTTSGQVFEDDFNGVLTGDAGGVGTINYMTGAFTTDDTGAGTVTYQWEDSNAEGVTDFTKSSPRQAAEGFVLRQDAGGDKVEVVIPLDGDYFSLKENSCYRLTISADDTEINNRIFRTNIGVPGLRAAIGTGAGIVFMNTANESKPRLNIIERNEEGDNFLSKELFPHFKFENYTYDDVALENWDRYVVVACRENSNDNNRILLCNIRDNVVDVVDYTARTFTQDDGILYAGDSVSTATYELFTGFDDLGNVITNYWESKDEDYGTNALKKTKRYRFRGRIAPDQVVTVSISLDSGGDQLIGTIRGDGGYIDQSSSHTIGTYMVGSQIVGGDGETSVSDYYMEIKAITSKFQGRKLKVEAKGYGYFDIESIEDFDIWEYQDKIPGKYRQKANVSLDGETTDLSNPEI